MLKNTVNHLQERKTQTQKNNKKKITQQPECIENLNIVDIISVIIEHKKISHKSLKAIKQAEKGSQVGSCKSLCKFL